MLAIEAQQKYRLKLFIFLPFPQALARGFLNRTKQEFNNPSFSRLDLRREIHSWRQLDRLAIHVDGCCAQVQRHREDRPTLLVFDGIRRHRLHSRVHRAVARVRKGLQLDRGFLCRTHEADVLVL
ncbi:hypothetical protein D9M72_210410 [compost metagenome]